MDGPTGPSAARTRIPSPRDRPTGTRARTAGDAATPTERAIDDPTPTTR